MVLLLLRKSSKLSQQQFAIAISCCRCLHPSLSPCTNLVTSPSQSPPIITCLPSFVLRSLQTSAQPKHLCLKCNLLRQEGFSASQVKVLRVNRRFRATSFEKVASLVSFLRAKGIVGALAGRILTRTPCFLDYNIEGLERKCKLLEDIGLGALGLQRFLSRIHTGSEVGLSVESLQKLFDFLQRIGLCKQDALKTVSMFPNMLFLNVERKLEPVRAFFERHGMTKDNFCKLVRYHPQVFGLSIDGSVTEKLDFVHLVGLRIDSNNGAKAYRSWITMKPEALLSKWECLKRQGFSASEVLKMVKQQPEILCMSENSLKRKIDYLKNVLNRDLHELAKYPVYFCLNLENRVIPRLTFISKPKEQGKLAKKLSLSSLLAPSDEAFERKFAPGYGKWKAGYVNKEAADV